MATTVLSVPTISCGHCENTIAEALTPLAGVGSVKVDIPAKQVTVEFDAATTSIEKFKEVLEEEEYPVASAS